MAKPFNDAYFANLQRGIRILTQVRPLVTSNGSDRVEPALAEKMGKSVKRISEEEMAEPKPRPGVV